MGDGHRKHAIDDNPHQGDFSFTVAAAQTMVATDRWWVEVGAYIPSGGSTTHSVTASFALEGTLNGNYDSTSILPAIIRMPVSLSVAPQNAYVARGSTQQYTATGTYSDGSTADLTAVVGWSSSSTQVATISSAGLLSGQAVGTSTISAILGGVGSSTTVTVTQSALVSITISPSNSSLPLGLTTQLSATANFADGSTQDFTKTVNWSSSQPSVASISSAGVTTSRTQGATSITGTLSTFIGSASLTVSAPSLVSAVILPGRPFVPPGTSQQLAITGNYSDGSSQDITSIVYWGSSVSNVATVSSTGLVTAVSTGTTMISATASGLTFLATVTVTSPGPPAITASVSPAPNAAGWNDSPVTVTFSCTPGGAPIANCPAPQVVSSEGANQVVTGTVTDTSGNSSSAAVTLNIDETAPLLSVTSPTDGETISVATVAVVGSLSDSLSGVSTLTCDGTIATPNGGSFSCNVSLNPGLNLIAVRATDTAGNVALAKMHVTYPVYPAPGSITITPTSVSLAVGQVQQFTATDNQGRPRPDATWSLPRRTTLATITTGSSPVLTALAAGQVTLTATVQGASAQTVVNIVTSVGSGSTTWTVPPLSGLTAGNTAYGHFAPAPPSADGPGLYSVEAGSSAALRALTTDGQQIWQQPLTQTVLGPDAYGDVLLSPASTAPYGIEALDAQTGSPLWISNFLGAPVTMRTDGNIIGLGTYAPSNQSPLSAFMVNGATGQTSQIPLPEQSTTVTTSSGNCGFVGTQTNTSNASTSYWVSSDTDGNAYVEYVVANNNTTVVDQLMPGEICAEAGFWETINYKLALMTIFSDGSNSTTTLENRTYTQVGAGGPGTSWGGSVLSPGAATPDGQGGVLATWSESFVNSGYTYMVSHVSSGGQSDFHLAALDGPANPFNPPAFATVVLDDAGTGFVAGALSAASNTIVAFDVNSGQPIWTLQPGLVGGQMFAQDGGGVIVQGFDSSNHSNVLSIDSSGNIGPSIGTAFLTDSWSGNWFSVGPGVSAINLPFVVNQASFWPETLGNPSQSGFGVPECPCLVQSSNASIPSQRPLANAPTSDNEPTLEAVQSSDESSLSGQFPGPSNCPICNLPQPEPPQCVTFPGSGATYLILVGDPGLNTNGHDHNVNDLFNLAAQQDANDLQAQGKKVIACRISSIQDFNQELTQNGFITGDVIYFGHSGLRGFVDSAGTILYVTSEVFVGQGVGTSTNITAQNVNQLCNAASGCNIDNFLSKKTQSTTGTAIRLNGCDAGTTVLDHYAGYPTSIAQLISNQLNRGVYAYDVGLYFSQQTVNNDKNFSGTSTTKNPPDALPMYMVPEGPPGRKPSAKGFCPRGICQ